MRALIPHTYSNPDELNGKSLFCYRLGQEFLRRGIHVVTGYDEKCDIALHIIRLGASKAKKNVLRINGVYHNSAQDYNKKNANIKRSLEACDAVVYQSFHSRKLCDSFIGEAKVPSKIIYNGADPEYWKFVEPIDSMKDKNTVLAFAKWRPHKRLRDTVESFLLADIENSQLVIVGDTYNSGLTPDELVQFNHYSNIHFVGTEKQSVLARYIVSSKLVMHLCWYDACPNGVVESLCAGIPVITNNTGGTHELLQECGLQPLVCHIDEPYNYKPIDLYNPPMVDYGLVADKIRQVLQQPNRFEFDPYRLSISVIADRYINFFEEILRES